MYCKQLAENTGCKKSPSGHLCTTLSGYIFATKSRIDNQKKKHVEQQCLLHMSPQYGELWPTNGSDGFVSLGHPCKFQRVSHLGSVTVRHSSIGHQPNCGVDQRTPPIFGRAAIMLGIGTNIYTCTTCIGYRIRATCTIKSLHHFVHAALYTTTLQVDTQEVQWHKG